MALERLQKIIARAGVASRRAAEDIILAGRIRVNGKVVKELGTRVDSFAKVEFDGKLIEPERAVYVLVHKPRGVICTLKDPEGRPTIAEVVKGLDARLVPVGRLDFHTSGALLMTNDGDFAAALAHPSKKAEKVYVAKVQGLVDKKDMGRWSERILIDDTRTQPAAVRFLRHEGDKTWLEITLREGKNRQIHRLGEHAGHIVLRLARLSVAGITTEGLRPGQWRHLTMDELKSLKGIFGVPRRVRAVLSEHTEASQRSMSRSPRSFSGDKPRRSSKAPRPRETARAESPPRESPRRSHDAPRAESRPRRNEAPRAETSPRRNDAPQGESPSRRRDASPGQAPSRGRDGTRAGTTARTRDFRIGAGLPRSSASSRGGPTAPREDSRSRERPPRQRELRAGESPRKPPEAATRRRRTPR